MAALPSLRMRPWRIVGASIGVLLLAIGFAAILATVENERVRALVEQALRYDAAIEAEADDLRVAVLELRQQQGVIASQGPSAPALAAFDAAHMQLLAEIDSLESIGAIDRDVPQPQTLRELAHRYHADFRDAAALYDSDPGAFRAAEQQALRLLDALDLATQQIDALGDRLVEAALPRVDQAYATQRAVLLAIIGGLSVVAIVLALFLGLVLSRLHASYSREQATRQALALSLRSKADFIADASHELRTPLAIIRGSAEVALGMQGEQALRDSLTEVVAEATLMSKIVDDLLFLARSDAGAAPLDKEFLPARWLVASIAKRGEVLAQARGSRLAVTLEAEGFLEADPARVEQAVLALVDNAARHSPSGTCVTLISRINGDRLAIEVADAGPGIPPDELPLIFDRFYQVGKRRTRKRGGSGLGLSIARTIVTAHGGTIDVDSRVNVGTRMTILLPMAPAPEPTVDPRYELGIA
jgi:two-component system sensor histidine kinase VicK